MPGTVLGHVVTPWMLLYLTCSGSQSSRAHRHVHSPCTHTYNPARWRQDSRPALVEEVANSAVSGAGASEGLPGILKVILPELGKMNGIS